MERNTEVGGLGHWINRSSPNGVIANEEQGRKHDHRSAICIADDRGDGERNNTPGLEGPRVKGGAGGALEGGGTRGREDDQDMGVEGEVVSRELGEIHGSGCTISTDPLTSLPDEIILSILSYLDISDLHALIKTSHRLRTISLDPLLHHNRLLQARDVLSRALSQRPSLDALRFPRRIWLSRRDYTSRELSSNLLKIKLNKKLRMRPDPGTLVERGVLPGKYLRKWSGEEGRKVDHVEVKTRGYNCENGYEEGLDSGANTSIPALKDSSHTHSSSLFPSPSSFPTSPSSSSTKPLSTHPESHYIYTTHVSPPLLTTLLTLQKQLVRDRLSSFVRASYPHDIDAAQEKLIKHHIIPPPSPPTHPRSRSPTPSPSPPITRRPSVRYLVNRFSSRARGSVDGSFNEREARWGRGAEGRRRKKWERRERVGEDVEGAGRARVSRLRVFFEGLSRGGGEMSREG